MTQYDLSECGIEGLALVDLQGALSKLRIIHGAPIVMLCDECLVADQVAIKRILSTRSGNLALHAGHHRIDDIVEMIDCGAIDALTGIPAVSYLRIGPTKN